MTNPGAPRGAAFQPGRRPLSFVAMIEKALLAACLGLASPSWAGLCSYDSLTPGLPKASCQFPSCPSGSDCQPPAIEAASPQVEFFEPLMKWTDTCPDRTIPGSCWEVYTDFKFRAAASDPSGVTAIGVHFVYEVNARRTFRKFFAKTEGKDPYGRYEITGTMTAHVPPGQRLEIAVYELCARDGLANEGCVLPVRRPRP